METLKDIVGYISVMVLLFIYIQAVRALFELSALIAYALLWFSALTALIWAIS